MKIVILGKQFEDKKQALEELAFCHYPVTIEVDGKTYTFEWFSEVERFFETLND
ncbi:MAG: hypothetical protein IK048_04190 [Clostridia bacterium]|nr:hypothetical protein [Clostridia bacterium]